MRRVLRFLEWRTEWWLSRQTDWEDLHPFIADGLRAYALRQAALYRMLGESFKAKWDTGKVRATRSTDTDLTMIDILYE